MRGATGPFCLWSVPLLVGLTIVAFGTSAPELMVNVVGALKRTDSPSGTSWIQPCKSRLSSRGTALMSGLNLNDQIIKRNTFYAQATVIMILDPMLREQVSSLDLSDGLILLSFVFMYMTFKDLSEALNRRRRNWLLFLGYKTVNWSLVAGECRARHWR